MDVVVLSNHLLSAILLGRDLPTSEYISRVKSSWQTHRPPFEVGNQSRPLRESPTATSVTAKVEISGSFFKDHHWLKVANPYQVQ